MKKLQVLVCLLIFGGIALSAESIVLLGGSISYASQNDVAGNSWSASSLGLLSNVYLEGSGHLGFYFTVTLGLVSGASDGGAALDLGQYNSPAIDMNILAGLGYRLPLGEPWTAVTGLGFYWGSTGLTANSTSGYGLPSYVAGGIGAGVGATLKYKIYGNLGIGANIDIAYIFANPFDIPATMSSTGLKVFGGVGVTF